MSTSKNRHILIIVVSLVVIVFAVYYLWQTKDNTITDAPNTSKNEIVTFGVLPYLDHSYAIVGKELGWFDEVGINLQIKEMGVEQIIPWLKNGTVDACSTPPGILMAAWDSAPELRSFVFGNMFTGYAIMGQPDQKYLTYRQLRAEGFDSQTAAQKAISQMKGKRFAYPPEDAIRPFIDLVLSKANIQLKDLNTVVMDDSLTVNAMRQKTADFQTGGAPSRVTLQNEGYTPIFTSADLIEFARASEDSPELAGVLQSGWATTRAFYEERNKTVLKLACVNYRIIEALQSNGDARSIHIKYLAKLTGTKDYSNSQIEALYKDLNHFKTFSDQQPWFYDQKNPEFYSYINGAILKSWTRKKDYYQKTPPKLEDVIYADDTYNRLREIKQHIENTLKAIEEGQKNGSFRLSYSQENALEQVKEKHKRWKLLEAEDDITKLSKELKLE